MKKHDDKDKLLVTMHVWCPWLGKHISYKLDLFKPLMDDIKRMKEEKK